VGCWDGDIDVEGFADQRDGSIDGIASTDIGLAVSTASKGALLPMSFCAIGEVVTASIGTCSKKTGADVASNTGMVGDSVMKVAFVGVEDGTSVEGATVNGSDDD
jgi:hypothetical protein